MSETKTIVLTVVRHGQTDANKKRLVQGEEFSEWIYLMLSTYHISCIFIHVTYEKLILNSESINSYYT